VPGEAQDGPVERARDLLLHCNFAPKSRSEKSKGEKTLLRKQKKKASSEKKLAAVACCLTLFALLEPRFLVPKAASFFKSRLSENLRSRLFCSSGIRIRTQKRSTPKKSNGQDWSFDTDDDDSDGTAFNRSPPRLRRVDSAIAAPEEASVVSCDRL
jgi:hypothetical protein